MPQFIAITVTLFGVIGLVPEMAQASNQVSSSVEATWHQSNQIKASVILNELEIYAQSGSAAMPHLERGDSLFEQGDLQGALNAYNQAIQVDPDFAESYVARGILHQEMRNTSDAISDLERAASLYRQQGEQEMYQDIQSLIEELR
ncbi:tetratricopeptide repeat protein [Geitlerinema sp. P-1104]|uniref:tetratricopeptide repeat protein n=1 Tax=Geitlerinema sp. P-1104 TaxID=2546230 RepID=UPI00197FA093|nr:tetratricopeptide repeat protein [Geitlerinema sp. P-1104]